LHHQSRGDNWTDTKFHQSTTVGSKNDTHPVERITGLGRLNTVNRNLTAHQENEKDNRGPKKLFTEGDLRL
jgi:hypothetical protein